MNEYLQQYLDGKIDYATYLLYVSPQSNTDDSFLKSLSKINRKEQFTGTGKTGDLSKSFNMDDEELDTFTSRGITPVSGTDYVDTRAELQGWDEQLANGIVKFAGKTVTGTVGGLAMLPGLVYGAATGSFTNVYDNAFQRSLDDANEAMDEALPNYVTKEEQKNNVLQSMGTMNFWANDMLGAASFVTGAIAAEFLSAGMYSAAIPGKVAKVLKASDKLADVGKLAGKAGRINTAIKGGNLARQMVSGAGYEAGVEARGFIDEAETNFINKFAEENGREPNDEELASAMDEIRSSANGLFAANLALVSAGNMITLPRFFGPGIKGLENSKSKWLSKVDDLSEEQLERVAKKKGISVDEVKQLKTVNKFDTFSKGRKALSYAYQGLEKPIAEGLIEEGGQSFMNKTALDYIDAKLFNDTTEDTASIVDSMVEGFKETYGGDSNDFWKEVFIGSLMGGITGFKLPNKKAKTGFGYDITNYSKDSEINKLVDLSNSLQYSKDVFASANRQAQLNNRLENAIAVGDEFEAKNTEDQMAHDFVTNKIKLGQFDQIEDEVAKEVNKMTDEEFAAEYGYENLSKEELSKRKREVVNNFVDNAKAIQASYANANRANATGDSDVTDGLSYVLYMGNRIDKREDSLAEEFNEKIGKLYNARVMKTMAKFIDFQNTKASEKITLYNQKTNELEKLTQEELAANNNRTSSEIMQRGKKLDELSKEITSLEKQLEQDYHSFLKEKGYVRKGKTLEYGRDSVVFKQELDDFVAKQKEVEEKTGKGIFKRPDVESIITDLNKLAKFRESQITTANYFFTKEGQKTLQSQIGKLKTLKEQDRITEELQKELIDFQNLKKDYVKLEVLAAESYKRKKDFNPEEAIDLSEKVESVGKAVNNLNITDEEKSIIEEALNKINAKLKSNDISDLEEFLNNLLIQTSPQLDKKSELLLGEIINEFKGYFKKKARFVLSSKERPFYVYIPPEQSAEIEEFLAKNFTDSTDYEVKISEDESANTDIIFATNTDGQNMLVNNVGIQRGIQFPIGDRGNSKFKVELFYKDKFIGYVLDPNRYKFLENGKYVDFQKDNIGHLRLLNPNFVSDSGAITDEGFKFQEGLVKGREEFNKWFDEIKVDSNGHPSTKTLKSEFFYLDFNIKFAKTIPLENFNIIEELKSKPDIYNIVDDNNPNGIPIGVDDNGKIVYKKVPLVVVTVLGNNQYYYYEDGEFKSVDIESTKLLNGILKADKFHKDSFFSNKNEGAVKIAVPNGNNGFYAININTPRAELTDEQISNSFNSQVEKLLNEGAELNYKVFNDRKKQKGSNKVSANNIEGINFLAYTGDKEVSIKITPYLSKTKDGKFNVLLKVLYKNPKTNEESFVNGTNKDGGRGSIFLLNNSELSSIKNTANLISAVNKALNKLKNNGSIDKDIKITGVNSFEDYNFDNINDIISNGTASMIASRKPVLYPNGVKEALKKDKPVNTKKESVPDEYEFNLADVAGVQMNTIPGFKEAKNEDFEPETKTETTPEKPQEPPADAEDKDIIDDNIGFKISYEESANEEELTLKKDRLESILPSWIPIKDIKHITNRFQNQGFTYGAFVDSAIYLAKNAPIGTEFHEAFHAVFRILLTDAQILKVYNEAKTKYGIPSEEQLKKLKNSSNLYSNKSREDLIKLYYEEKLADDFQKYMGKVENPSFIQKMFAKIKRFIDWVFGNKNYIDYLFKDIKSGKFTKYKSPINKLFLKEAAFKTLEFEEVFEGGKRKRTLSSVTTNNIKNKILAKVLDKARISRITNRDIKNIIKDLVSDYYTESNFQPLFDKLLNDDLITDIAKSRKLAGAKRLLSQINNALSSETNQDILVNEIKELYNNYKIIESSTEFEEDEDTQDSKIELFAKETSTKGGASSLSKEMKKYLQFIPSPVDELNLGIKIEANSQFTNYADAYELYNNIARILANLKPGVMLKSLFLQQKANSNIKYFAFKLFNDIATELNMPNISMEALSNLDVDTLAKSNLFNLFVSNFRKSAMDYISVTPDIENNRAKVFRSNSRDVKDLQFNEWANNAENSGLTREQQIQSIGILKQVFDNQVKEIKDYKSFNKNLQYLKEETNKLGIELTDNYLKLSLFKALSDSVKDDLLSKVYDESYEYFNELDQLVNVYSDITYLNNDITTGLLSAANQEGGSIYKKIKGDDDSGAISKLKSIAEGNSYFDNALITTVFKNIEGKNIYSYVFPNYITDLLNTIKSSPEKLIEALQDDDFESFQKYLAENDLSSVEIIERYYFDALKSNPLLNDPLALNHISNLSPFILDGSRVIQTDGNFAELTYLSTDDGKAFQSLSPRGKFLNYFYLYETDKSKGVLNSISKPGYGLFIPFQNEGKSTQYAFMLPKENYITNEEGFTDELKENLFNIINQDFNRVKKALNEIRENKVTINKFNTISKETKQEIIDALDSNNNEELIAILKTKNLPREFKIANVDNDTLYDLIVNQDTIEVSDVNDIIKDLVDNLSQEMLDLLSDSEIGLITKQEEGKYTNNLLPKNFQYDDGKLNLRYLQNFILNDFINSYSVLNLMVGDIGLNFKDTLDLPKRMAGLNASGNSLGYGKTKISIIDDFEKTARGKSKAGESTDAQSYSTQSWYENKYLKSNGKFNDSVRDIYKKMRKCIPLSLKDKEILEEYGALDNPRKISIFSYAMYGKTSVKNLNRNMVSFVRKENQKKVNTLVNKLYSASKEDYNNIIKELVELYEPIPQFKRLHNLLNKMELNDVGITLHASAIKTVLYNSQSLNKIQDTNDTSLEGYEISDLFIREQVITDNMKTKVVDGTQLLQLIDSEQDSATKVSIDGKEFSVGDIVNVFKKTKEYRIKQTYDELSKTYKQGDLPKYKALLKSFKDSIEQMGDDPILQELLSATENLDMPKFNLNLARSLNKVEKMLYSYLGQTLSHKVAGQKFTLMTDYAYEVQLDDSGNIITSIQSKNGATTASTRDLEVKFDKDKNCYYAECVISPQTAKQYGLSIGSEVRITNKKFLEYVGTRIPTQEKSSMVYLRVVDFLPVETGNTAIVPNDIRAFSGADFDIDSLFTHGEDTYGDNETPYGNYLTVPEEKAMEKAFEEYTEFFKNSKGVRADFDRLIKLDEKYNSLLAKLEYNEYSLKILSVSNYEDARKVLARLSPENLDLFDNTIKDIGFTQQKFVTWLAKNFDEYSELIQGNLESKIQTAKEIKELRGELFKAALRQNKYYTTLEEFTEKLGKQVKANYKNYNNGDLLNYSPLTTAETSNLMLELKKVLVHNTGNAVASERDAERTRVENFIKNVLEPAGIKDNVNIPHYFSLASRVKTSIANAKGGENIGIAALGNIMGQYLMQYGTDIYNVGEVNKYFWDNNQSINEVLTLWLSLAVDNMKHQDAGRFNITSTMQGALILDTIVKRPTTYTPEHQLMIGLVPKVKELLGAIELMKDPFKTKKESQKEDGNMSIEELIKSYLPAKPEKLFTSYTIEEVVAKIKNLQDGNSETEFENAVLYHLIPLLQTNNYTINFTQLLSFIKGTKPSTSENLNTLNALEKIGIKVNSDGTLSNTDSYIYSKKENPSLHPIDFLEIINKDRFLKEEILKAYKIITEDSGLFLIASTKPVLNIMNNVLKNFKPSFNKEANIKRMTYLITNTLGFRALRKNNEVLGKGTPVLNNYITASEESLPKYIKAFNELKASGLLKDNFLMNKLSPKTIVGKPGTAMQDKVVHYLSIDSFIKLTPNLQKQIADDMYNLFFSPVLNLDGTINKELTLQAQRMVGLLINQIYIKDAGLFVNETVLPFTEPFFFNNFSSMLFKVQDAIRNKGYEEVLGISLEQFEKEFTELFVRDSNNIFSIRSNKLEFINNNIKKKLISFIENLKGKSQEGYNVEALLKALENIDAKSSNLKDKKTSGEFVSSEEYLTAEDFKGLSPIIFNDNKSKLTFKITPGLFNDLSKSPSSKKALTKIYIESLLSTGLVNETFIVKDGEVKKRIQFLEYLGINETVQGKNVKRYYKLQKVVGDTKENPLIGWEAKYDEILPFGNKGFLPYFFPVKENEEFYSKGLSTPTEINKSTTKGVAPGSETKINIYAGTNENAELSNFAIRPFMIGGDKYQSVEQYFQLQKFQTAGVLEFDYDSKNTQEIVDKINKVADEISKTSNGAKLKSLGGTRIPGVKFNEERWNIEGKIAMKTAIKSSFEQNPNALNRLLNTGNSELTHTQDKTKWGNLFPEILMEVRNELKLTRSPAPVQTSVLKATPDLVDAFINFIGIPLKKVDEFKKDPLKNMVKKLLDLKENDAQEFQDLKAEFKEMASSTEGFSPKNISDVKNLINFINQFENTSLEKLKNLCK